MNTIIPSVNPEKSLPQINVFDNADGNQCVSARELQERLEITHRFNDWFNALLKYGFVEYIDYTPYKFVHPMNQQETLDYSITIEMAKQICMLQRSEKGREYREYFLKLEKAWNSPEAVIARGLQFANRQIESIRNQVFVLQKQVEVSEAKNEALASDVLTWADRKVIQAIIGKYGANRLHGDFKKAWSEYKKELLYKHSINLNARKTAYYNNGGKESNLKVLDLLDDSELPDAVRTAVAMAQQSGLDISDIVEKRLDKSEGEKSGGLLSLADAAAAIGIPLDDLTTLLHIKQYIYQVEGRWQGTGMGVEFGHVVNEGGEVFVTEKCLNWVKKAVDLPEISAEERKRVDAICAEAERNARYNGVGKAE